MKVIALVAAWAAACRVPQGGLRPSESAAAERAGPQAARYDPADPRSVVEHVCAATRARKSYQTRFTAVLTPPEGDAIEYQGTCVWVRPGILYIHYTAKGGDEKRIVRAGEKAWVYHSLLGEWVSAEDAGLSGAGRGIQNPDEVLSVLARHAAAARSLGPGGAALEFSGDDIEKVMREQAQAGSFTWKESRAEIAVHADARGLLRKFECRADLKPADPNLKGRVRYSGVFDVVSYDAAESLTFRDEKGQEIPLSAEVREAVEKARKENR
jgi:hypothetical protein